MGDAVLVTGGAGYIGCHTCKALAKAGFLPVTYDNLSTGHAYSVKWGPFVQGDLTDRAQLDNAFKTFCPKAVIHFAADAILFESIANPIPYYKNNIGSTIALLEAMRDHQVPYLVFSSTCATYGHPQFTPITEAHPQVPVTPYGRSKQMVEQILADFELAYGLCSLSLRYFNAAGADLETEVGENHMPETHLIPSMILTALGVKEEISIYGTDFPSRDGSAVRDYIHVQDLAEAHLLALQWLLTNQSSEAINLGSGRGHSIFEILDAVQKFCGKTLNVRLEKRRQGEPAYLTADNRKAQELLGWAPQYSDLSTLIESAWKWHQFLTENASLLHVPES